ncbi:MAG TPA: 2-amino-4-hydroxy-6-hydroxymethyldihydropteridine diphosphokinase [Candidatus Limnocylindrales bacterium]|nr:2-amino-4-hydroxy-6-hydroxymethyldihydropteridine diphosphokinase [Candidatus Limnocylindrales bacterium]
MRRSIEVMVARTVRAYIGLGANVGDARRTLSDAVAALDAVPGARRRGVSRLYVTRPVGVEDQPDFHNAVVALDVPAGPDPATGAIELLVALKAIERDFGRQRRGRWGPRELDLDLLLFGRARLAVERPPEAVLASAALDPGAATRLLEVPHPSMRERLFVLAPLADLAPGLVPPGWHETVESARRRRVAVEGAHAVRPVGFWSDPHGTWLGPSGKPVEIRPARGEDADETARTHTAAAQASYRGYGPPDPGGLERRTNLWREVLPQADNRTWVAVDDGRIVGLLNIGSFRDHPDAGAVRTLYVLPGWWGTGVGQRLMELAHAELARDYREALLTVLADNRRARRFYERNGWEHIEDVTEPHFGGTPTAVSRYRRDLP